ncbi:hypothetical protein CJ030_MR5G009740 [Morella rubra]|uniref:Uncharacterized protein n=1 Tax=Morella rubra TaxID=262757 RepID=A0A6A1VLL1_9ROSI|nr:hypothetical protein CJ030_MR5G009740 [Morella rubra]
MLTTVYLCLLYGLYVPDWEYQIPTESSSTQKLFSVKCGIRGDTGPGCNAVGMIDRKILGIQHLYRRATYARTQVSCLEWLSIAFRFFPLSSFSLKKSKFRCFLSFKSFPYI